MKTFDEAIAIAMPTTELKPDSDLDDAIRRAADAGDIRSRYLSLSTDAATNGEYRFLSTALIQQLGCKMLSPADAIMTAFVTGCITGCEMEKHDTGGIDLSSLPEMPAPPAAADHSHDFEGSDGGPLPGEGGRGIKLPDVTIGKGIEPIVSGVIGFRFFFSEPHVFLLVDGVTCTLAEEPKSELIVGNVIVKVALPVDDEHLQCLYEQIRAIAEEKGFHLQ